MDQITPEAHKFNIYQENCGRETFKIEKRKYGLWTLTLSKVATVSVYTLSKVATVSVYTLSNLTIQLYQD